MDDELELLFGASHDPSEVFLALSTHYRVIAEPTTSERWTCLDTADWRLHEAGMTLRDHHRGKVGELVLMAERAENAESAERLTAPSRITTWPRHPDALTGSPVRDRVAAVAGVRALLPMATVDSRRLRLRLLDEIDKTRVRVQIDQQRLIGADATPLPLRVVLRPLRGYRHDAERAAELLTSSMAAIEGHADAVAAALAAAGRTPGVSLAPRPSVDPQAPAARSIALALRGYLDKLEANRQGVLDDVDIEFLHDLRTSLTATRSILRLTDDVLPGGLVERFGDDLRWLAHLTSPVRDLDLAILVVRGSGDVSTAGLDGLAALDKRLAQQRRGALRAMHNGLTSARATTLIDNWRTVLTSISGNGIHGVATAQVAADRAELAYRKIRHAAADVTPTMSADDLHALRRRCKRMRYLLEGLDGAYDAAARQNVLSALKKLQDQLGAIQDAHVHRTLLTEAARTLPHAAGSFETVLATGALVDRLDVAQAAARDALAERLATFIGKTTKEYVAALRVTA